MKNVQKRGKEGESCNEKAPFNVEAHEAEVPIRQLASQCTTESDNHRGKTHERQRKGRQAK